MTPRTPLVYLVVVVAFGVVYALGASAAAGELVPPLDDTFIHFQYARRIAEGHPFSYQPGDGYSSGATSMIWPFVLALGWLAGARDMLLYPWALGVGALAHAATAVFTWRWLSRVGPAAAAWWGGLAVAACGPLLWGAFSGMEVPLFTAALAGTLDALTDEGSDDRPWRAIAAVSLLALVRPEGALLAGALVVAKGAEAAARWGQPSPRFAGRGLAAWLLPVSLGALQPALNLIYTGSLASASGLAKQARGVAIDPSPATFLWRDAVGSAYGDHFFDRLGPLVLVAATIGAWTGVRAELARRRVGPVSAAAGAFVVLLVFVSAVLPLAWHHYRYLLPGLAALVPLASLGAARVDALVASRDSTAPARFPVTAGLACAIALAGLPWAHTFALNTRDIRLHQVAHARWIAEKIPTDAVIGANDVGALAYLGGRRVLDLEGIVSPDMLAHAAAGEGAVWARLTARPPDVLVVFSEWFPTSFAAGSFDVRRHARLSTRSISGGDDLQIVTLVPGLAAAAAAPPALVGDERVVDTLDVGAIEDEAAHGVVIPGDPRLLRRRNIVARGRAGELELTDSARRLDGPLSATLRLAAGPTRLVVRLGPSESPARLGVFVGGAPAGELRVAPVAPGEWRDVAVELPPDAGSGDARVDVVPIELVPGPRNGWMFARAWTVG